MTSSHGQKVVVHYLSHKIIKGYIDHFDPAKTTFHVNLLDVGIPVSVDLKELKAVFFVKAFQGKKGYHERKEFHPEDKSRGRGVRVEFMDGESLIGLTTPQEPTPYGFFMSPLDPESNNDKVFVVNLAVQSFSLV
jgi:hypothetical protein